MIAGFSLAQLAIVVIIVAAVFAIVWVAIKAMGLAIPSWVIQILWIVLIALVAIVAIKLVLSF